MPHVLTFDAAAGAGPQVVGGKGWNTGRLSRFGFRIPPGCAVAVNIYWEFLALNHLMDEFTALGALTADDAASDEGEVRLSAFRIRIEQGTLPAGLIDEVRRVLAEAGVSATDPLAVRSSATAEDSARASFAGIHRSLLNVVGDDGLAAAIKGCYASLWTPTAVSYRRKLDLTDSEVGAALVVQKLITSLYAGVAFSADPVTGRRDRVVVNAAFGLGEAVVSGSVEADEYHVHIDHTGPVKLVGGRIGYKHYAVRTGINGGTVQEELGYAERSEPVLQKPGMQRLGPGEAAGSVRATLDASGFLQGVAVSSGQAVGLARLIRHPREGSALRRGEVLVAPSTDPAWTPLFLRAAAVVMEVGGYLSHGAIVAREYGIPAVVNVAGAMQTFQDGQTLLVDGDTGKVRPKQP